MIGVRVVFEHGRDPDRRAAQARDVSEILRNALDVAAVKTIWRGDAARAGRLLQSRARLAIVEAIHQKKIDEFLAPLAGCIEVGLALDGREIDLIDTCRVGHEIHSWRAKDRA